MYEMLIGMAPFYGNTEEEIFERIVKGNISVSKNYLSSVSKHLIKKVQIGSAFTPSSFH